MRPWRTRSCTPAKETLGRVLPTSTPVCLSSKERFRSPNSRSNRLQSHQLPRTHNWSRYFAAKKAPVPLPLLPLASRMRSDGPAFSFTKTLPKIEVILAQPRFSIPPHLLLPHYYYYLPSSFPRAELILHPATCPSQWQHIAHLSPRHLVAEAA